MPAVFPVGFSCHDLVNQQCNNCECSTHGDYRCCASCPEGMTCPDFCQVAQDNRDRNPLIMYEQDADGKYIFEIICQLCHNKCQAPHPLNCLCESCTSKTLEDEE